MAISFEDRVEFARVCMDYIDHCACPSEFDMNMYSGLAIRMALKGSNRLRT